MATEIGDSYEWTTVISYLKMTAGQQYIACVSGTTSDVFGMGSYDIIISGGGEGGTVLATPIPVSVPDTVAPIVNIISPSDQDVLKKNDKFIALATDTGSGIKKIELFIDGVSVRVCWGINLCEYTFNNRNLRSMLDGTHALEAIATDNYNNTASASPVIVVVDAGGGGDAGPPGRSKKNK